MLVAAVVLLVVLLVVTALLLTVVALRRRTGTRTSGPAGTSLGTQRPAVPALGSPAQVWVERGERVAVRLRELVGPYPALTGAADDADAVVTELRGAAGEVAALDVARARLTVSTLEAERERLGAALDKAAGRPAEDDLRTALDAVVARLGLAARNRAAADALLARMRAAVAGMERTLDELAALLAEPAGAATAATALPAAATELADRLAGFREGLAEVRAITGRAGVTDIGQGQGLPGDLPGSVEGPPRT